MRMFHKFFYYFLIMPPPWLNFDFIRLKIVPAIFMVWKDRPDSSILLYVSTLWELTKFSLQSLILSSLPHSKKLFIQGVSVMPSGATGPGRAGGDCHFFSAIERLSCGFCSDRQHHLCGVQSSSGHSDTDSALVKPILSIARFNPTPSALRMASFSDQSW